MTKILLIGLQL